MVAELAGDPVAARQVHLVLPETGVCSAASSAWRRPAAAAVRRRARSSCCVADEVAKAEGEAGCGCGTSQPPVRRGRKSPDAMSHVTKLPAAAIWALGVTQIIGYGTLYYAFSVLAPEIGAELWLAAEWVFGALTLALLAGGLAAPGIGPPGGPVRGGPDHGGGLGRGGADAGAGGAAPQRHRLCHRADRHGGRLGAGALCDGLRRAGPDGRARRTAQHHPPDADRRLCLDAVLAVHLASAPRHGLARRLPGVCRAPSPGLRAAAFLARDPAALPPPRL